MSEIFLKSNDLSLGYSNQIVIKGINLNLFDEKNYQIIGKNGAGKTSILEALSIFSNGKGLRNSKFSEMVKDDNMLPWGINFEILSIRQRESKNHLE